MTKNCLNLLSAVRLKESIYHENDRVYCDGPSGYDFIATKSSKKDLGTFFDEKILEVLCGSFEEEKINIHNPLKRMSDYYGRHNQLETLNHIS